MRKPTWRLAIDLTRDVIEAPHGAEPAQDIEHARRAYRPLCTWWERLAPTTRSGNVD
jgi:hypothetical protein